MGRTRSELCSLSTIPSSMNLLNSELNILDFKQISRNCKDDKETIVQLINVCYELASTIKRNSRRINDQFEELARYQSKMKIEFKEKERLQMSLVKETNRYEALKAAFENQDVTINSLNSQIKSLKANVSQLQHAIALQKLRHDHDSRRKDVTISGLKEKLYRSYSNESGMTDDKRSPRSNTILSQQYDEILDRYVCQLHNNVQVVLEENATYRTLLESIYDKLVVEIIDCPESVFQKLSGLPSHAAVKAVETTFHILLKKLQNGDSN